jgi:hypothetical protein
MATARVLNFENNGPISVGSGLIPSPQGCIIPASGSVNFTNNSGGTITVTVIPASVFGIGSFTLQNGGSQLLTAQIATGSVSYYLNGNTQQPYAIQVGAGPMLVQIAGGTSPTYTPQVTAIPAGGTLQMNGDQGYNVLWTSGQPVTPANLTHVYQGMGGNPVHTGIPTPGQFVYNCSPSSGSSRVPRVETGGGGIIIVRST